MKKLLASIYFLAISFICTAQLPRMLKDINSGSTASSYPRNFCVVGNTTYFSAYTPAHGFELWKTDGTELGTVMIKDIFPDTVSSNPSYLKNVSGVVFFNARNNNSDYELWKTDGTAAGTVLVKDINPGQGYSDAIPLAELNGQLLFYALTPALGGELWKTDGTEAGTVLVKDINPGFSNGLYPKEMININGSVFFKAKPDNWNNWELWKTDGTTAGTVLVKDILPGNIGSNPEDFINYNNIPLAQVFWRKCSAVGGSLVTI